MDTSKFCRRECEGFLFDFLVLSWSVNEFRTAVSEYSGNSWKGDLLRGDFRDYVELRVRNGDRFPSFDKRYVKDFLQWQEGERDVI
jgi:hypothetical protein